MVKTPYPSQWAAIEDADRHTLVVAGAGTGKTFTVVRRILYMLGVPVNGRQYANPVTLDEIAAITFTNQAAKELKEDLRKALRATGRREESYQLDQARIGTIHGFCTDLLRENALRRGVAPVVEALEEGEATARATQAARDALVEALEEESVDGLAELLAMWDTGKVDRWTVDLMRRPDLIRALSDDPASLDNRERALLGLARLALAKHDARLANDRSVDFDRMILWTRDLLHDNTGARRALQRRLRLLVIDEFQDVDPAQKQIAYALGEPESDRTDTPRLMLVGDPTQSIYRFRRADVTVWKAVEQEFSGRANCAIHPLEENFRSVPAILAFVDASVGVLLDQPLAAGSNGEPAGLAEYEVEYRPVTATRDAAGAEAVELLVTPPDPEGRAWRADEVRNAEATAIAQRACELHAAGVKWCDMALLLAAWTPEPIYTRALRNAGVPVYVLRDQGFFDRREVLDLILALQVVRDPADDTALIGFLRGPFIGLRDESLLHIARQLGYTPYWPRLRNVDLADGDEAVRLDRAVELLWRYVLLRDRIPAADLLDAMMHETGFLAHLALLGDDGKQAIANVRRFLAMARDMNGSGTGDLLRAIRESRERDDRVAQARLFGPSEDVLLITSIHVSKGLQWPVVFWADLGAWPPGSTNDLLLGRNTFRLGTPESAANESPEWRAFRDALQQEAEAERKRLWYVAATRARDRLIVSGIACAQTRGGSLGFEMLRLFPELNDGGGQLAYTGTDGCAYEATVRTAPVTDSGETEADGEAEGGGDRQGKSRADHGLADEDDRVGTEIGVEDAETLALPPGPFASPVGLTRHSATEFLSHVRCARRHWFRYTLGIREPEMRASKEQLISAVARGQIVHDVLERYEADLEVDALLEDAIGRWDPDAPAPDGDRGMRYREHLNDEVTRVLDHPEYAQMVARRGARRELPFLHVRPDGTALQGFIDLAVPAGDGNGLELLDVKTTQCNAAAARVKAQQYEPQRDVYAVAAEAISGVPVTRFAFQFSRAGEQIAADLDERTRTEADARIDQWIDSIESGANSLTSFAAECGYCGYRRFGLCPGVTGRSPDVEPGDPQLTLL